MFRILSPAFAAHQAKTFQTPCRHIVDTDLILAFTWLVIVDQRRNSPKTRAGITIGPQAWYHAKRRKVNRIGLVGAALGGLPALSRSLFADTRVQSVDTNPWKRRAPCSGQGPSR